VTFPQYCKQPDFLGVITKEGKASTTPAHTHHKRMASKKATLTVILHSATTTTLFQKSSWTQSPFKKTIN
jgi:hypothetical protein